MCTVRGFRYFFYFLLSRLVFFLVKFVSIDDGCNVRAAFYIPYLFGIISMLAFEIYFKYSIGPNYLLIFDHNDIQPTNRNADRLSKGLQNKQSDFRNRNDIPRGHYHRLRIVRTQHFLNLGNNLHIVPR